MDPEKLTVAGFAAALLGVVIWILKFVFIRLEKTINDNADRIEKAVVANTHGLANQRQVLVAIMAALDLKDAVPPPPDDKGGKMY